jgi:hypothetical protein
MSASSPQSSRHTFGDGPVLLLGTFGFGLYPVKTIDNVERCLAIAGPNVPFHRHRPKLVLDAKNVDEITGDLTVVWKKKRRVEIELSGLAASFGSRGDGAQTLVQPGPIVPKCPPITDTDFSLVPRFESMCGGVSLKKSWRHSESLQCRFDFANGYIFGWPDEHTKEKVWQWALPGLQPDERRVSGITVAASQSTTPVITFSTLTDDDVVATVKLKPLGGAIHVKLINLPVDASGEYEKGEEHEINLAHVHATLSLCDIDDTTGLTVVFGHQVDCSRAKSERRERQDRSAVEDLRAEIEVLVESLKEEFSPRFEGNPSCAGRTMDAP